MPAFVATTTDTVVNSFVSLFTTLLPEIVSTYLPILVGLMIVMWIYRKAAGVFGFGQAR